MKPKQRKKKPSIGRQWVKPLVIIQAVIQYRTLPSGYCQRCQKHEGMSAMTLYTSFDRVDAQSREERERLLDVAWRRTAREQQSGAFHELQTIPLCDSILDQLIDGLGISSQALQVALLPHLVAGIPLSLVMYTTFLPGAGEKTQGSISIIKPGTPLPLVLERLSSRGFQQSGSMDLTFWEREDNQ